MVKQAFAELEMVETLVRGAAEDAPPARIAASDLYAYARGDKSQALEIKEALLRNPSLRAALRRMVETTARYQMPEAIAASTDDFPERRAEGCRVRMERSRAEDDQYYLIVELAEGMDAPSVLTLCDPEDRFERVELPPARRGVIQVTVTTESGVPAMLRDPKTAVFLG